MGSASVDILNKFVTFFGAQYCLVIVLKVFDVRSRRNEANLVSEHIKAKLHSVASFLDVKEMLKH